MILRKIKDGVLHMSSVILIAIYIMFTVSGITLMKVGTGKAFEVSLTGGNFKIVFNYILLCGILCYLLSFILYIFLISKYNLNYIVPLTTGLVYILIFVLSLTLFKEPVSVTSVIGFFLVIAGVVFLNIKK